MKITALVKSSLVLAALLASFSVFAYELVEDKPVCKKPRFTDFSLPEYNASDNIEVNPETEFFFKLPVHVDPSTITLTAKKRPLEFTVESTSTFHKVIAKLPASLTGYFVRLDAYAQSTLGCDSHDGWLIKIAGHEISTLPE